MADPVTVIKETELNDPSIQLSPESMAQKGEVSMQNGETQSFGIERSLVSFASGISAAKRWDIMDSMLFAQLAADKNFSIHEQTEQWYSRYKEVMKTLGWVNESDVFGKKDLGQNVMEVRSEILDILKNAFGITSIIQIANSVLGSLKKLEDKDSTIIAFKKSIMKDEKGAFQIANADETDGVVSLLSGVFKINAKKVINQFLFFRFSNDLTSLTYNVAKDSFQEADYDVVKEIVKQKLGSKRSASVFEIEL